MRLRTFDATTGETVLDRPLGKRASVVARRHRRGRRVVLRLRCRCGPRRPARPVERERTVERRPATPRRRCRSGVPVPAAVRRRDRRRLARDHHAAHARRSAGGGARHRQRLEPARAPPHPRGRAGQPPCCATSTPGASWTSGSPSRPGSTPTTGQSPTCCSCRPPTGSRRATSRPGSARVAGRLADGEHAEHRRRRRHARSPGRRLAHRHRPRRRRAAGRRSVSASGQSMVTDGRRLFVIESVVGTGPVVAAYDVRDGRRVWEAPIPVAVQGLAVVDHRLFAVGSTASSRSGRTSSGRSTPPGPAGCPAGTRPPAARTR